jgi:hypothetical protein
MAKSTHYTVVHPIYHGDNKEKPVLHPRGAKIALSDEHAEPLLASGSIVPAEAPVVVGVKLGASTLAKLSVDELHEYARVTCKLTPKAGITKAELLSEIDQSATAAEALAEATNEAVEEGRL